MWQRQFPVASAGKVPTTAYLLCLNTEITEMVAERKGAGGICWQKVAWIANK